MGVERPRAAVSLFHQCRQARRGYKAPKASKPASSIAACVGSGTAATGMPELAKDET